MSRQDQVNDDETDRNAGVNNVHTMIPLRLSHRHVNRVRLRVYIRVW
jgi:hypothetical protein